MRRLTVTLLAIGWLLALSVSLGVFLKWPSTSSGCPTYNCTYIPTPYPGCYYILVVGSNQTLNHSCQICQPRTNGTLCYNEFGPRGCPSETSCNNVNHTLGRWLFFSFSSLLLLLGLGILVTKYVEARNAEAIPLIVQVDGQRSIYPKYSVKTDYSQMNWS